MRGGLVGENTNRWRRMAWSLVRSRRGIPLNVSGPSQPGGLVAKRVFAALLGLAITAVAVTQYRTGHGLITVAWLAIGPLLASLLLWPLTTAVLAGWAVLLGLGLMPAPARPAGHARRRT